MQFSKKFKFGDDGASSVTPYFWIRHAMPSLGSTPKGGTFYLLGVRGNNALKGRFSFGSRLGIGSEVALNHDPGAFGFNPGWVGRAVAFVSWKLNKHWSIQLPYAQVSSPVTHTGDGRRLEIQRGFGLQFSY